MFQRLTFAVAAVALACTPAIAAAQGQKAEPEPTRSAQVAAEATSAASVKAEAPRVYAPIDFNTADDLDNILYLDLSNGGRVAVRLKPDWAPLHVARIKTLAREGFYDGVIFHRVIDGFMAQTGDPTGTGQGGSPLPDLTEEFNPMPHVRGTVSMARAASPDSANSQFFIVFYPRFALDRKYTNFGRVISGMEYVDAIQRGEPPANPTKVVQASIAADNKARPVYTAPPAPAIEDIDAAALNVSPSS